MNLESKSWIDCFYIKVFVFWFFLFRLITFWLFIFRIVSLFLAQFRLFFQIFIRYRLRLQMGFSITATKLLDNMDHFIWTKSKKDGSPLSPDLSSWSSKWNNFPYTSNLNVWRVLFMTNHFVTFQEILNIQSAENSLAISWKPLESYLWSFTALPISDSSGISDRNCLYSPSLTWFTSFDPSVLLLIDFNLRLSVLHQPVIKSEKEKIYDL